MIEVNKDVLNELQKLKAHIKQVDLLTVQIKKLLDTQAHEALSNGILVNQMKTDIAGLYEEIDSIKDNLNNFHGIEV